MSDKSVEEDGAVKPGGKKGLLAGLLAALVLGGGGFYATYSGLIGGSSGDAPVGEDASQNAAIHPDIAFVPLDPMVISLGSGAVNRHLRFTAQLEVVATYQAEVAMLKPRVLDVLNGYLRAVDSRDIEGPSSLGKLRAQMLRRVQVVTGKGRVRDLLIIEFVLN